MVKLVLVVGLAGAGKSHMIGQMVKSGDYIDFGEGFHPHFDPPAFRHRFADLVAKLQAGQNCIVTELALCQEGLRRKVIPTINDAVPNVEIVWKVFENDKHKAEANLRRRESDPRGFLEINERMSQVYSYPAGVAPIAIVTNWPSPNSPEPTV